MPSHLDPRPFPVGPRSIGPLNGTVVWLAVWLTLVVVMGAAGCRPADEIRTYRIAKGDAERPPQPASGQAPNAPLATPPTGEPTHRLLGAILAGPEQAWFFKAVGPKETLDGLVDPVREFFASVEMGSGRPTWTLPDGWSEEPGSSMRLATLKALGDGESETEISVIGLPLVGDWDQQILDNVNRWRGQLKLADTNAEGLDDSVAPLEGGTERAVFVDVAGWFDGGSMAPFASAATAAPAPTTASAPGRRPQLKSDTPDGWIADDKANSIRAVSLKTPGGAEVTGFVFPAAGMMADQVFNANRWRGEVGLGQTTAEELANDTEKTQVLGEEGSYFGFVGEEEATAVAMVEAGQGVWFFKLRGPKDEVAAQEPTFRAWLKTLSL